MRRKGIEPIVSVVLLLLITIALAGGVFVWLNGTLTGSKQDILVKGDTCLRINGTDVRFTGYIYNTQDTPISKNKIGVRLLNQPNQTQNITFGPTTLPTDQLNAGAQVVFNIYAHGQDSITGARADMDSGPYAVEFASNAIVKANFNCA